MSLQSGVVTTTELGIALQRLRDNLPTLHQLYQVRTLGVFGSYVRGKQTRMSDLDLLVDFEDPQNPPGLLKFLELENLLSDQLGIKVDLVMRSSLKPHIGKRILEEVIYP
jgi:predicted nucleotidyltransferase